MISLLSLFSLTAATQSIKFRLESNDTSINNSGVFDFHFQDDINAIFPLQDGYIFQWDKTNNTVYDPFYFDSGMVPFYCGQLAGTNVLVTESNATITPAVVDSGYLTVNGSNSVFYTCDQLDWDPLEVGDHFGKGIAVYAADETVPGDCNPVKIHIDLA